MYNEYYIAIKIIQFINTKNQQSHWLSFLFVKEKEKENIPELHNENRFADE